ncbi:MAG TPA: hypothetical protein VN752_07570 [Solirubrobacterales bacterium]|nr:hypothetical protein [Solirubrobacterales bacterium]
MIGRVFGGREGTSTSRAPVKQSPDLAMPVSTAAVHTRPRPSRAIARRAPGAISKVAWQPDGDLGQPEWLLTGRRLGAIGRCSQWWIGDWVRYGTARWGERYAEAARVTGYDAASLRNMAWVASRFDLSLRSDKLSWSHHVLLAPLEAEEQSRWLGRALRERLSVADLRLELRCARGETGAAHEGVAAERKAQTPVCPHCGHQLGSGGK